FFTRDGDISPQINSWFLTAISVATVVTAVLAGVAQMLGRRDAALRADLARRDARLNAVLEQLHALIAQSSCRCAAAWHAEVTGEYSALPLVATPVRAIPSESPTSPVAMSTAAADRKRRRRGRGRQRPAAGQTEQPAPDDQPQGPTLDSNWRSYLAGIADRGYGGRGDDAGSVG
ncbi:MAG: hypothetical protein QOE61_370, partial [Micromonosporaceae bacterium]|nr:hypothetical protein [Micromonosporaceae bacterium]